MAKADRIKAIRRYDLFIVPVEINGLFTADFIVDTGSSFTTFSHSYAKLMGITNLPVIRQQKLVSAQGVFTAPAIMLQKLQVGGAVINNIEILLSPHPKQLGASGLLGGSFLRRFRVTFEYDTNTLVLRMP